MSKGDRNRTADREQFWKNYDRIFKDKDPVETEPTVMDEIIDFLKNVDLEEYPVQRAKELYKKYLTTR